MLGGRLVFVAASLAASRSASISHALPSLTRICVWKGEVVGGRSVGEWRRLFPLQRAQQATGRGLCSAKTHAASSPTSNAQMDVSFERAVLLPACVPPVSRSQDAIVLSSLCFFLLSHSFEPILPISPLPCTSSPFKPIFITHLTPPLYNMMCLCAFFPLHLQSEK